MVSEMNLDGITGMRKSLDKRKDNYYKMRKRNDAYKTILNSSVNTSYSLSKSMCRERAEKQKTMDESYTQDRMFDEFNNPTDFAQKIITERLSSQDFNRQVFGQRHRDEKMFINGKFEEQSKHSLTEYSEFEGARLLYKKNQNLVKQSKSIKKLSSLEIDKLEKNKNIHKRNFSVKEGEKKVKDQASTIASDINKNMKKMNNLTKEVTQMAETFYGIEEEKDEEED